MKKSNFSVALMGIGTVAVLTAAGSLLTHYAANAAQEAAPSFSAAQKEEMQKLIGAYIKEHPQEIMDSVRAYQDKLAQKEDQDAEVKVKEQWAALTAGDLPYAGNAKGDVTLVEFFDYNCGFCKKAIGDIKALVDHDKQVRVVFLDMPILGPSSKLASEWSLAAINQGKYFEYHVALMNFKGEKTEETLSQLAKDVGLDVAKLKADAASKPVQERIASNLKLAETIGIRGTPAFIVNGELYRGYLGDGGLEKEVQKIRTAKKG